MVCVRFLGYAETARAISSRERSLAVAESGFWASLRRARGSAKVEVRRSEPVGCSSVQGVEGSRIEVLPGIGRAHFQDEAAYADAHDGADLEEL